MSSIEPRSPNERAGDLLRAERAIQLREFVAESNRIEGIHDRAALDSALASHEWFLESSELTLEDVEQFALEVTKSYGELRRRRGMNVRVGGHLPPPGGREIERDLTTLLEQINEGLWTPYQAHVRYETLHPFMDGNGRSGRAVWLWQMARDYENPFGLPFLHRFYYQALDASRA